MASSWYKYADQLDRLDADKGGCCLTVVTVSWTAVSLDLLTSNQTLNSISTMHLSLTPN